jgi:endonuclease YncB( thermonuclease family)
MMRAVLVLLGCLAAAAAQATADAITGHPEVVDGDGLAIGPIRIRLHGIDAAEFGQRCAEPRGGTWGCDEAAAERLEALIGGGEVTCEPLDRDAYGRIIARCTTAGGVDLAEVLVAEGLV